MARPLVRFEIPYRIYLPGGILAVKLDNKMFGLQVDYAPVGQVQNGIVAPSGPDVEYSGDIFGYAGRSVVSVIIPEEVEIVTEKGKDDFLEREDTFISTALLVTNRLIEVYAQFDINNMGAPSVHVLPITRRYIANISIRAIGDDLKQVGELVVSWPIGFRPVAQGDVKRPEEVTRRILDFLSSGKEIHIYRQLLTSALNHLWRQVYRLVPVEASAAVEAFTPLAIQAIDSRVNVRPDLGIYEKLILLEKTFNAHAPQQKRVVWFSVSEKGWQSLISHEISDWHKKCYEVRNKVIHRGYSSVNYNDALNATNSATALINHIGGLARDSLNISVD